MKIHILIFGLTAALLACGGREQTVTTTTTATAAATAAAQLPPGHPPIDGAAQQVNSRPATASGSHISGEVLETMNAGDYTYMRLGTPKGDFWAAVPQTTVKKGSTVTIDVKMLAEKFQSNTLHRTFDKLAMGVLAPGTAKAPATPAAHHMATDASVGDVKVEKAAGGLTVAEAWAKRSELKDKPVVIRGKVVKYLGGIMGKNWIHLRDGSGSHAQHNDDITVTTQEQARVGDVVTVSGTVHIDSDFGSGYTYPIIIEDAKLKR